MTKPTARLEPPKGKLLLQHYTCPTHGIHALMLCRKGGLLTRLSGTKCCGTWTWVRDFVVGPDTLELERAIAENNGGVRWEL